MWELCGDCALLAGVCQVCGTSLNDSELALASSDRWASKSPDMEGQAALHAQLRVEPVQDGLVHLATRSEISTFLRADYDATAKQVSNVLAAVYLVRTVLAVLPAAVVVATVPALAPARAGFFALVIAVLVALVAWHVVTGWLGTFQAVRGRGDAVLATFLVFELGVAWGLPRRGPRPQATDAV